ncbi:DUF2079 domain-containing protein [Roseofilum reptotaenium CS-1145]|uniref:Uncharacterized protein n=1 Tax=Roseofilum reptotaenium AO1-A TaxID=1925591 RepID=A0A1L9QND4_9CYAN|nr:DUF2079 domain-containing protein [Roseofilum reptotaenium]MDB9517074.1 DUF2079 domain-containing protein [Roseofilum reptotaenium CS-1145]OJJ24181.1 hypothetical protein BI308_18105 [Roseofilum reptotaenium AO1-A]
MSEVPKSKSSGLRLVIFAAIAFFLFSLTLTLHRHYTFYSTYNQGLFNQMFWNSLHGRFFNTSLGSVLSAEIIYEGEIPTVTHNHLGQNFTPAMLLGLPLYALFPHGVILIVIQVILVTAAGLVLYILAREYLNPPVAAMIACSFYSATAVLGPTLADFHTISQFPLLVFSALLALEKRWWWLFAPLILWILGVREDSGFIIFGIGVYLILSKRYSRLGIGLCTLSFAYILIVTNTLMPQFSADVDQRFLMDKFGQYLKTDEVSAVQVLWELIKHPGKPLTYLVHQVLPLAFIPMVSLAAWCISGFPLLLVLLGQGLSRLAITAPYAMVGVPGLFYGVILWWSGQDFHHFTRNPHTLYSRQLTPRFQKIWSGFMILSILLTIMANPSHAFYFLVPESVNPWIFVSLPEQWKHAGTIESIIDQIPPDGSVSATQEIIPHLSGRPEIIRLPGIELRNEQEDRLQVEYLVADLWRLQRYQSAFTQERHLLYYNVVLIDALLQQRSYGILEFEDGVVFLRQNVANDPEAIAAWLAYRQMLNPLIQNIHQELNPTSPVS